MIAALFGYRLWSADFLPQLAQQAAQIVRRDVTPGFIVAELIAWLNEHKIVRPGYTTLQTLISEALSAERRRLGGLLAEMLDESATAGARPAAGTRRHVVGVGGAQAGRQKLQMASDGARAGEARQAGTVVPDRQDAAAEACGLATAICITTQVWRISTPCMICAASRPSRHIYICCATLGSATGNSPTIWSTP